MFFVYFGHQSFIGYIFCKYFLPVYGVTFLVWLTCSLIFIWPSKLRIGSSHGIYSASVCRCPFKALFHYSLGLQENVCFVWARFQIFHSNHPENKCWSISTHPPETKFEFAWNREKLDEDISVCFQDCHSFTELLAFWVRRLVFFPNLDNSRQCKDWHRHTAALGHVADVRPFWS